MGTTADKLQAIVDSTNNIRAAINEKGVDVDNLVPLRLYGDKIREITTGGPDRSLPVLFFDYDGTLLHSYTIAEAQALTSLPELPTHDLLTGDGWTHTLEQVRNVVGALHVGAQYRITDGKTHAWVTLTPASGLALPICFTVTGTATIRIDWGDGQTQNVTATSTLTHNYATYGDYEITLERIAGTGTYGLGRGTNTTVFIGVGTAAYYQTLTKIYIGDNVSTGNYSIYNSWSLVSAVISSGVTSLGAQTFAYDYSLISLVIPNSVTSTGSAVAYSCFSLASVVIPSGFTSMESCGNCYSLTSIVIPKSVDSLANQTFINCNSLTSLTIPDSVASIGSGAFDRCRSLREYFFERETPPTLGGTIVDIPSICKIYVPDSAVNAYKTATTWVSLAKYIYPISQRP